jgi:rhodanese-related sulfurtransferase
VVNCAGRTRSIIGTQSLVNAGIPNPVCALRNGTIGWTLAGLELEHKADKRFGEVKDADRQKAAASALALLFRAGVQRIDTQDLQRLLSDHSRNTYVFDVRSPQEYTLGHLSGARSAPGGQLVQETDHYVGVRGARIVVYDDDGVRASMTASWLAQMGWETYVLKDLKPEDLQDTAAVADVLPDTLAPVAEVDPVTLKEWLANRSNLSMVIDVGDSATYVKRHIPGAWWLLRSQMAQDFSRVHKANRYVLTCADGIASRYAVAELQPLVRPGVQVLWLPGGNAAWTAQGFSTQQGESYLASPRIDRYRRPYEGLDSTAQAMQAYLDWEYGLVEQLRRDGSHHFKVI